MSPGGVRGAAGVKRFESGSEDKGMARTEYAAEGVNLRSGRSRVQYPVEGTAAYVPARVATGRTRVRRRPVRRAEAAARSSAHRHSRTLGINRSYVFFLIIISAATVLMCVEYLRLKESITVQNHVIEQMESQLLSLRSENDALLDNLYNSVDLAYVKDVAIHELGMKYATEDQIVWYNTDDSFYIRQYREVGDD